MPTDPNQDPSFQTGGGFPAPPDVGAISAQPQVDAGQPPQPGGSTPDRHSALGRLTRSLFTGTDTSYQYDDQGKLVETQVKQKPGQLFRHMLAGALLGGAIGAEDPTHTFAGGFTRGGAGVQMDDRKQDEMRRAQAKEAYEMRLKGIQSGREGEKLGMEKEKLELEKREQKTKETLAGAQTAMYNSEVLRNNTISQGASLEQHMKAKQFFAPEKATLDSMGLEASQKNVSESDMHNLWSKRPDSGGLTWIVTDVKMGADDKGMPTYEYVYSGYDLKKDVPLSVQTLKLWKDSGLDKTHPEIFKLKAGTMIPANNYKAWNQQALGDMNQKLELDKASVDIAAKKQGIVESQARAAKDIADANKMQKDQKKETLIENAMTEYEKVGHDISQLDPKYRAIIVDQARQVASTLSPMYSAAVQKGNSTGDYTEAQQLGQKLHDLTTLATTPFKKVVDATKLPKPAAGQDTSIRGAAGLAALTEYLKATGGNMDDAVQSALSNGWTTGAAAPTATSSSVEPAAGEEITGSDLLHSGSTLFRKGMEAISGR